jgi:hypothetical protein
MVCFTGISGFNIKFVLHSTFQSVTVNINFTVLVLQSIYEEKSLFKGKHVLCPTPHNVPRVWRSCAIVLLCDKRERNIIPDEQPRSSVTVASVAT